MADTDISSLPALDDLYEVPAERVEGLQAKGHTVLRGVASAGEVAAYRTHLYEAALRRNRETRPIEERDTYGKAFLQCPNLWRIDDAARRFVFSPRFAKAAADLLGVEGVRLYHDQALFKESGGGHTPWHQDQFYWPLDTDKTVTMWMPLVDTPPEVGSMTFASGTHLVDLGAHLSISDTSEQELADLVTRDNLPTDTHGVLAAGDATFHMGRILHRASDNPSPVMREVMTIIYYADGARVSEPAHRFQEFDMKMWLGGRQPGDLADSDRNPRLWPPE